MTIRRAAILALACGLIWPATIVARRLASGYTCTDDLNGDRRPDRWRVYDASGRLVRIAVDTNFDGRADVEEYYREGRLVRRDIDRNFDGRVDDREEFDPATGEPIRSVVDVDFDGTADELLLFDHGKTVARDWVSSVRPGSPRPQTAAAAPESSILTSFHDPFAREHTWLPAFALRRQSGHPFVERAIWVLPVYAGSMFYVGEMAELRSYGELVPLVAGAALLILGSATRAAARPSNAAA